MNTDMKSIEQEKDDMKKRNDQLVKENEELKKNATKTQYKKQASTVKIPQAQPAPQKVDEDPKIQMDVEIDDIKVLSMDEEQSSKFQIFAKKTFKN